MVVFERMELPGDNTFKCTTETRPDVAGTFMKVRSASGLGEARTILATREFVKSRYLCECAGVINRSCPGYVLA